MATLLLIAFVGAFASPKVRPTSKREITMNAFTKLIVGENIHVVLIADDNLNSITVTGDQNFVNEISVVSGTDKLVISSTKNISFFKKNAALPVLFFVEIKIAVF